MPKTLSTETATHIPDTEILVENKNVTLEFGVKIEFIAEISYFA